MGGAERTARKRRQQQLLAAQSRRAPGSKPPADPEFVKRIVVRVGIGVLVVAVIVGGWLWMNASKNATEGQAIPPELTHQDISSAREGMVAVAGQADAPVTIDVYADFLCPACRQFEEIYADRIAEAVKAGDLRVRHHMVPMLVNLSDPPGYSLDSANAGLCAADAGRFVPFHDSLFATQPAEGARGYDKEQLTTLGRAVGITGQDFAACVAEGRYDGELLAEFEKIKVDPSVRSERGFGTPTVTSGGKIIDVSDDGWLATLLAAARK